MARRRHAVPAQGLGGVADNSAGTTMSYGALAAQLGMPKAVRAVGHANGANPISVVVPCHRLIGANGSLTGYGGGLERKRWLLEHEGVALKPATRRRMTASRFPLENVRSVNRQTGARDAPIVSITQHGDDR